MNHYHLEVYRGHRIVIDTEDFPENPRELDVNLGTMVCFHTRYTLGDIHDFKNPAALVSHLTGVDEEALGRHPNDDLGDGSGSRIVWEPLYLYDHSGITMSTKPFSCPFDSGQVGIIYCTYQDIAKYNGLDYWAEDDAKYTPTQEQLEQAKAILNSEVETYDTYIRGEVLAFSAYAPDTDKDEGLTDDEDGFWMEDPEDSCSGFYDKEDAIETARRAIDGIIDGF